VKLARAHAWLAAAATALHAAVCDGRVKLTAALNAIASNWQTAEQVLGLS
jgi:hypothetical protein